MHATRLLPLLLLLAACSPDRDAETADGARAPGDPAPAPATKPADAAPAPATAEPPRIDDLVHADDTLESLRARLGADVVVPETLPGAEGESAEGWILYPDDPTRRLSVYLDHTGQQPLLLIAGENAVAWTRADGVRIGLSSQSLAKLNGGAFSFMGFGWDYGGVVTDWRGGRLAPDGSSAGPVRLCPPTVDGVEPADYPVGDQEFGSDDARVLTNPAVVCEFGVNVDPPAAPAAG
jgi:hypothetical protein